MRERLKPGPFSFSSLGLGTTSRMPRPHPAHTRRRGLVSQVWMLPETRRAAITGIMRKREHVLQSYRSKWYEIHYPHWQIYNPTLKITRLAQRFRLVTPDPSPRAGWGLGTRLGNESSLHCTYCFYYMCYINVEYCVSCWDRFRNYA